MKRIFYIMGLALMAFTVSSCSQEDEMAQELQTKDRPMTAEDIRPLQDFAASFARFYTKTEPILQKRMARAKAGLNTASDNQRDIQAMGLQAEMLGAAAQQMFLEIGFTEQELDNLCPLEDKEVYAVVGVQMLGLMMEGMPELVEDCPIEPGGEEVLDIDWRQQVEYASECASAVLGLNIFQCLTEELLPGILDGTMTKKLFKETAEKVLTKAINKLAGKLVAGPTYIIAEWGACIFIRNMGWEY